jgi:DNA-binding LacI/PurR family transcriptional regulator
MVTLKDVAKRAEVSISTASRILSNSPKEKFAEATHVKVPTEFRGTGAGVRQVEYYCGGFPPPL